MHLLAVIVLALTFLGGVVVTLSTQVACSALKVKADAVPTTTSSATNLMQVVHLTDWTVEGLKALWLHFRLGPTRSLRKTDLECGLAAHMKSHGIEILIKSTAPGRRPMQQHSE
jgi:hypothetical protein